MSTPEHHRTAGTLIRERGGPSTAQDTALIAAVELSAARNRLPPNSMEAEQGALSCCLQDPANCVQMLAERTVEESFYDLRHREIREALLKMAETGTSIDLITLNQYLKDRQKLEMVGGLPYLSGLLDAAPSSANIPEYLKTLREKLLLRKLSNLCVTTAAVIHATEDDPDTLVSQFEEQALKIRDVQVMERSNKEAMVSVIDSIQKDAAGIFENRLETGLPSWDHRWIGYPSKNLVVLAGRPSAGKTAMGAQISNHLSSRPERTPGGIFSLEMTQEEWLRRSIGNIGNVDTHPNALRYMGDSAKNGGAGARDMERMVKAAAVVSRLPLIINDTPGLSIQQICSITRRWVKRHGIKFIVVDYLQLIRGSSKRSRDDRRLEIAEISGALKGLAKSLDILVICLSQLNREVEKRGVGSRPKMSDLREAGEIEQDADFIQFLWYEVPPDEQENRDSPMVIFSTAKCRNGPTGDVKLMFRKSVGRFEEVSTVEHEEEKRPRHKN